MSSSTQEYPSAMAPQPPAPLRWQSWPVRDDAVRAALMVVGLLALGVTVRWLTGQTHLAVLAVLAVTLIVGVIYALVNIVVDVVHALLDPRVAENL